MPAPNNLLFVHGMGEGNHDEAYEDLKRNLDEEYHPKTNKNLFKDYKCIQINWSSNLNKIQKDAFRRIFPSTKYYSEPIELSGSMISDFGTRMRNFFHFYLGDVIAYTTKHDNHIRSTMIKELAPHVQNKFSILAHSLGSVIISDILLHTKQILTSTLKQEEIEYYKKLEIPGFSSFAKFAEKVQKNLQSFVSFGSPIGLFLQQELAKYGNTNSVYESPIDSNKGQKWLNILDYDDFIAYPVVPFFGNSNISDEIIDVGSSFVAHGNYWDNREVARTIANYLS